MTAGPGVSRGRAFALLLATILGIPSVGRAQDSRGDEPYSIDQVAEAVATGLGTRMLERARANCISFFVDVTTVRRLRAAGAEPDFTTALREACYVGTSLEVTTEPAGAEVWVQDRLVGTTPWVSPMAPARKASVEVRLGGQSRRVTLDIVPDSLVSVHFDMPRDTASLPVLASDFELRNLRVQAGNFSLSRPRPRPRPPTPPTRGSSVGSVIFGGLIGAAAGVAAGTLLCRQEVAVYTPTDTINGIPIKTQTGTERKLQGGCVGFSVGGGAAAGGVAGNMWAATGVGRRRRRYDEERKIYERQLARWEEQRRAAELLAQNDARRAERERLVARNAEIRAANEKIGKPRISVGPPTRLSRAVLNYAGQ